MSEALFLSRDRELRFHGFRRAVSAATIDEVAPALAEVESAVGAGLCAAGYLAYEAAPGLNPELAAHKHAGPWPLASFGLYETMEDRDPQPYPVEAYRAGPWTPEVSRAEYEAAIAHIREYLAAGDSYQVNYTFGLTGPFQGSSESFFRALCRVQRADYCAHIDLGRFQVLSASPELFFDLDGEILTSRPMKGTRPRSHDRAEDVRLRDELAASSKDRAENVMIVDLLRNDMGRISRNGSVEAFELFQLESYPTVWQMTSAIRSRTDAPVTEILRALFPCGSVTGAPKRRTMQIIKELEPRPRGPYCGAVGYWLPGRRARFNVAIRTVTVDAEHRTARYCVGSGVTWYSTADAEYDECLLKAAVLDMADGRFELLESLLFEGEYFLLDRHLARLDASASFFGFELDVVKVRAALDKAAAAMTGGPQKVRLLICRAGRIKIEHAPAEPIKQMSVALADKPVDERGVFLRHKTTRRDVYDAAMAARPDADDVLLWNSKGQITETCLGNIVAEIEGCLVTPPLNCGLLPGTMRAELLEKGIVKEQVINLDDLPRAKKLFVVNSVRKWVDVQLAK